MSPELIMSDEPYRYPFQVRLHDTDAAGVLFFGHLFRHVHDAYESLMEDLGFPLHELFRNGAAPGATALPVTHAEAGYRRPIRQGDRIEVLVTVADVRRRSFALDYRFNDREGHTHATARTVHVLTGPDIGLELPEDLRRALTAHEGAPDGTQTPSD
jgi:1,4-dihydroxy-2-naphthoyl-CoA hydrolase